MKTTIEIADPLLIKAKTVAAQEKTTLRALIEEGLREVLKRKAAPKPFKLKDCSYGGGGLTPEFEAKGGMAKLREAAYPGFFDDEDDPILQMQRDRKEHQEDENDEVKE